MTAVLETQKAVYLALTSDATLMSMVTAVYDFVPIEPVYPFVTIGDISADDNSALGLKRYELSLNINVYSQATGRSEVLNILERLRLLLDDQLLNIIGFTNIFTKFVSADSKYNSYSDALNGVAAVKIYIEAQ